MDDKLIIVKVKDSSTDIINYLECSFIEKGPRYYSVNQIDSEIVSDNKNLKCKVVFVIYKPNINTKEDEIQFLYIGNGIIKQNYYKHVEDEKIVQKNRWIINYTIKIKTNSDLIIKNFISNSELDLKNDFGSNSYVSIESSKDLISQLNFIADDPYIIPKKTIDEQQYSTIENERILSEYSQFNQNCIRVFGTKKPDEDRGEFQRDYERIIHAKAYRRLVDKAQIFSTSKGDYYRTRITHTLEVTQISRAIAIGLNLNVNLTEAIAQSHDLGHTPFGHQGERTLDSILKNEIEIIENRGIDKNYFGGFKHNFQGLRVANFLEEKYIEFEGLDLSYQVLEGILKHTKFPLKSCNNCQKNNDNKCDNKCYDLKEFFPNGDIKFLYPEITHSTTLEGQIVAIADEIAQRGHDLDDAFSSNNLTIDELSNYLNLRKMNILGNNLEEIGEKIKSAQENNRAFIDKEDVHYSRIVSLVIGFFIKDVIKTSRKNLSDFVKDEFYNDYHRFKDELICFSKKGKILCDYLEKIISKKVINSIEVSQFDNKASMIVENLFRAYYSNPKLLHKGTLRRIYVQIRRSTINVIDFCDGDNKLVKSELKKITQVDVTKLDSKERDEYMLKRKILVRGIADYISGMTDTYAMNEYKRIFLK